jgi:hypothetical protein
MQAPRFLPRCGRPRRASRRCRNHSKRWATHPLYFSLSVRSTSRASGRGRFLVPGRRGDYCCCPVVCRFLGRLHDVAIHVRRRQASEKRQGTEIAVSGQRRLQQALWGFGRSRRRWDGALGEQDWVAATGSRALEDSWTSGKDVEALAGDCCEPRVRGNGTHRVVADR